MKYLVLTLLVVASFGCASASTTSTTQRSVAPVPAPLRQDVLTAIRILDVTEKGIIAASNAKPPLLTAPEVNQARESIQAAMRLIQATNSCAHSVLTTALTQLDLLSFGGKIKPFVLTARGLAADGFWQICSTTEARPIIEDGVSWEQARGH